MVITIIHCEFRVVGAGVVVYRRTLHVFVQKVCLLSLSRKTLHYGDEDEQQQSRDMFLKT